MKQRLKIKSNPEILDKPLKLVSDSPISMQATADQVELNFPLATVAKRVLFALVLLEFVFVVLDYHINYGKLIPVGAMRRMFNIAREDGLASWVASTQTLFSGLFLMLIYFIKTQLKPDPSQKWIQRGWLALTCFFLYMAFDDGAQIHERVASTVRYYTGGHDKAVLGFFPSYAWQLLFIPIFASFGLVLLALLWIELKAPMQRLILVTALSILVLAVGLDFVEGLDQDHPWNIYQHLNQYFAIDVWSEARFDKAGFKTVKHFGRSLEESLEMLANTFFLYLFMTHIPAATKQLQLKFSG